MRRLAQEQALNAPLMSSTPPLMCAGQLMVLVMWLRPVLALLTSVLKTPSLLAPMVCYYLAIIIQMSPINTRLQCAELQQEVVMWQRVAQETVENAPLIPQDPWVMCARQSRPANPKQLVMVNTLPATSLTFPLALFVVLPSTPVTLLSILFLSLFSKKTNSEIENAFDRIIEHVLEAQASAQ